MTAMAPGETLEDPAAPRFSQALMHRAATLQCLWAATQAEVALQLGVSRATVSRLLSQARQAGIVRIEAVKPVDEARTSVGQT